MKLAGSISFMFACTTPEKQIHAPSMSTDSHVLYELSLLGLSPYLGEFLDIFFCLCAHGCKVGTLSSSLLVAQDGEIEEHIFLCAEVRGGGVLS